VEQLDEEHDEQLELEEEVLLEPPLPGEEYFPRPTLDIIL
jgi:hypothetical protein